MLGERIKTLRTENSLTQKDLAEKLFVTAQAVSRWENDEVEPSITTLTAMAKIFNISVSELLGEDNEQTQNIEETEKPRQTEEPKAENNRIVLAVCEQCNRPIFNGSEIVRKTIGFGDRTKILCKDCDNKNKVQQYNESVQYGVSQRKKSYIKGGIYSGLITLFLLFGVLSDASTSTAENIITASVLGILFFPFLSCLYLHNNFIMDMVGGIATWSIRFPGVIFSLDLDGIIWLITVKLLFWVLGALISICCFIFAIIMGLIVSPFVYPFALVKSYKHPERAEK